MNSKIKIRDMRKSTIISIIGILFIFTGVAFSLKEGLYPETYKDCGTVKNKVVVPGGHKGSGKTFMGVRFQKTGFKSVQVDETTYLKYEPGDFVCFNLTKDQTVKDKLWILFKMGSCMVLFFGIGVYLLYYAINIYSSEENKD